MTDFTSVSCWRSLLCFGTKETEKIRLWIDKLNLMNKHTHEYSLINVYFSLLSMKSKAQNFK